MRKNTFIIPIIRDDLIERCLDTIYKFTDPDSFYVYVIDQTKNGIDQKLLDRIHLYIRPYRNLGFSKSCNTAIKLVETEYFTLVNDDVEFINTRWWQGIEESFAKVNASTPNKPAVGVNASSIRLPGWSVNLSKDFDIMPHKDEYTEEDYDFLLTQPHKIHDTFTIQPGTMIDGVTLFCTVFNKELFDRVGLLDEKFYPGGGEDYDWNSRANLLGFRVVGTTLSWVWHHWGMSMSLVAKDNLGVIDEKLKWNSNNEKWGDNFDVWGAGKDIPPTNTTPL